MKTIPIGYLVFVSVVFLFGVALQRDAYCPINVLPIGYLVFVFVVFLFGVEVQRDAYFPT